MNSDYTIYVARIITGFKAGFEICLLHETESGETSYVGVMGDKVFTREQIEAECMHVEKGYMKACQEIENCRLYDDKSSGFLFTSEKSLNQAFDILHKHVGGTFLKTLNP